MLVLTRRPDEAIYIGKKKQIKIRVLKIMRDKVSIGIDTDDPEIPILREELVDDNEEMLMRKPQNKKNGKPHHDGDSSTAPNTDIRRLVEAAQLSKSKDHSREDASETLEEQHTYHP